jgi:hypothetical protein
MHLNSSIYGSNFIFGVSNTDSLKPALVRNHLSTKLIGHDPTDEWSKRMPSIFGALLGQVEREESFRRGQNSRLTMHLIHGEIRHLKREGHVKREGSWHKLLTQASSNPCARTLARAAGTIREQPGEETIPDDPKRS